MKHKTYDTPECIHKDKSLHKIIMHNEKRYLYVGMMEKRDMRTCSGHYLKGVFLEQVLDIPWILPGRTRTGDFSY